MPDTVLDLLVKRYPTAKRQNLRRMVQAGRVRLNGKVVRRVSDAAPEGAVLAVDERPAELREPKRRRAITDLEIVHEDEDLLVAHKPCGLLTSTNPRETRPTLLALVRAHLEASGDRRARVGLIHRLDRDASGLLVFSKNDAAYRSLKQQFQQHTVDRVYLAVVHGKPFPPVHRVQTHLVERADGRVYSTEQHGKGEWALTDYEVLRSEGAMMSLLRVTLQTGRKHQIRVHLSEKGHPIVGDRVYGPKDDPAPRLMLAAVKLSLVHPRTGERMTWELPAPEEYPVKL